MGRLSGRGSGTDRAGSPWSRWSNALKKFELSTHLRDGVRQAIESQVEGVELLRPEDIADAVSYIVTRDHRVAVDEILVRAGEDRANPPCAAGIAGGSRRLWRHGRSLALRATVGRGLIGEE